MAIRFQSITTHTEPAVRTRSVVEAVGPVICTRSELAPIGSEVTRAEYEALLARVEALEAVTKAGNSVTRVTKPRSNGNALTPAEKQRRYRERQRAARS